MYDKTLRTRTVRTFKRAPVRANEPRPVFLNGKLVGWLTYVLGQGRDPDTGNRLAHKHYIPAEQPVVNCL